MKNFFVLIGGICVLSCAFSGGNTANGSLTEFRQSAFPDYKKFEDFRMNVILAQANMQLWTDQEMSSTSAKLSAKNYVNEYFPKNSSILKTLEQDSLLSSGKTDALATQLKSLNDIYTEDMGELASFADYNDPVKVIPIRSQFNDADGDVAVRFSNISKLLEEIQRDLDDKMNDLLMAASN